MLNRREALALSGSALALSACATPRTPNPAAVAAATPGSTHS
jgi:hypothetical protein